MYTKDVTILKSSTAKTDNAFNCTYLLSIPQAKKPLGGGGIYIGPAKFLAGSRTSLFRCRCCQTFHHTTKACKFEEKCDNCGNLLVDSDCNDAPHCINCNSHNINMALSLQQTTKLLKTSTPLLSSTTAMNAKD